MGLVVVAGRGPQWNVHWKKKKNNKFLVNPHKNEWGRRYINPMVYRPRPEESTPHKSPHWKKEKERKFDPIRGKEFGRLGKWKTQSRWRWWWWLLCSSTVVIITYRTNLLCVCVYVVYINDLLRKNADGHILPPSFSTYNTTQKLFSHCCCVVWCTVPGLFNNIKRNACVTITRAKMFSRGYFPTHSHG